MPGARPGLNRILNDPYKGIVVGRLATHYRVMAAHSPEEVLMANFNAIQAMLAWQIDSEREFEGERRTLIAACNVLMEQEELSAEFVEWVRTLLAGWSVEKLTNITVQAQSLPVTAAKLRQEGDVLKQAGILQEFLVFVLQASQERNIREYGMQVLTRLKLEGGISEDALNRMLTIVESAQSIEPDDEEEEEDGGDEDDGDAEEPQSETDDADDDPWGLF